MIITLPPIQQYLSRYQPDEIIYPAEVAKEFNIDIFTAYKYLDFGVDANLTTTVLKPYCEECKQFFGSWYKKIRDIRQPLECPYCGKEIDVWRDAIVVYRKNNINGSNKGKENESKRVNQMDTR